MAKHYFTYDPEKFHFTGHFITEEETIPDNSTEVPVPICDGERYAQWNGEAWVVKHLVDGEWVNCTDDLPVININPQPIIPAIEGETNGEQI